MLSCVEGNKIRSDTKGLLELFNIVNNKYKYFSYEEMNNIKYDILKDYVDPNLKANELYYFVWDIHPILSRMLKDTLNTLVDEKLIYKREYLMFGYYNKFKNEDGSIVETRKSVEATDSQIEDFMKCSKHFMNEFGYKKWSDVPYFSKGNINKKICAELNISYVYDEYELILNKEFLNNIIDENKDLKKLKNEINKQIIEKLYYSKQGNLKNMTFKDKKENVDLLIK